MNQVRVHGDPFGEDAAASLLRSFVRLALGSGMRCALSLSAVRPREPGPGERSIALTDGVRNLIVGTRLPPAEIDLLLRAAGEAIAATAPVLVFTPRPALVDAARLAGLEWPLAATVIPVREDTKTQDLLERVRGELRWAGSENPPHALDERELASWLTLPVAVSGGTVLYVGDSSFLDGKDLAVDTWLRGFADRGHMLRLLLSDVDDATRAAMRSRFESRGGGSWEIVRSSFEPGHARDAAVIVLPWRHLASPRVLVQALASGRPVCVSRFAATAPILGGPGTCLPIGGRNVPAEAGEPAYFAPHPRALTAALTQALGDPAEAAAIGRRARQHVVAHLTRGRPSAPPLPLAASVAPTRPSLVLEAPFFETSSSAELSIETARALRQRGIVDLKLVPTVPFHANLETLRARAPELEPLMCRKPGFADLWLSSGWPVRAARPASRMWALRVDWEFGALPLELTPHVTQDADRLVVHSEHVFRVMTAAGRCMHDIRVVPHGVDAPMHEHAIPDAGIVQWKQGRPAVLFCGGLIWRKGFDVFLSAVLAAREAGANFCVVVKAVGRNQHYGRFHLVDLLERVRATPGTPPILVIDREQSRAELASTYAACDLLLHPYRGEGFGLPVLEARACGLPVIATSGGAADCLLVGPGATKIPAARRSIELPQAHVSTPWIQDPSAESAGQLLIEALAAIGERKREARAFAATVRAAFPWGSAAEALEKMAFEAMHRRQVSIGRSVEPVVTVPVARPSPEVLARVRS